VAWALLPVPPAIWLQVLLPDVSPEVALTPDGAVVALAVEVGVEIGTAWSGAAAVEIGTARSGAVAVEIGTARSGAAAVEIGTASPVPPEAAVALPDAELLPAESGALPPSRPPPLNEEPPGRLAPALAIPPPDVPPELLLPPIGEGHPPPPRWLATDRDLLAVLLVCVSGRAELRLSAGV